MKTLFFYLVFILYFALHQSAIAQSVVKDAITVNGLKIGEEYTHEQFVKALGVPTKIDPPTIYDEYENIYKYNYNDNVFFLINGEFNGFGIVTADFAVNGFIRVGDNISQIDRLGGIKTYKNTTMVQTIKWRPSMDGLYSMVYITFYYNDKNQIESISAFINIY